MNEKNEVKLADFGSSKSLGHAVVTFSKNVGTYCYSAEEMKTENCCLQKRPSVLPGKHLEAAANFSLALESEPENEHFHYERGCALFALKRFSDADFHFRA